MLLAVQLGVEHHAAVGGGLLLRSVHYAQQHDPGFKIDDVMVATAIVPRQAYDEERTAGVHHESRLDAA